MSQLNHKESIKSSLIIVLAKWIARLLGLISTVVIARILMPEDFGLIATAMIFIGFVDLLSMFGLENALIRKTNTTDQDYNTVWTLQIIQKLIIGMLVVALSPLITSGFDDPRLLNLLQVMAIAFFISAFKNIGVVNFRKHLAFKKEFNYTLIEKILGVIITIILVLYYRNYWGIAYAIVLKSIASLLLSFILAPYRPKLSLIGSKEFIGFSMWEFLNNFLRYAQNKIDDLFVARTWGASILGHLNLSKELSSMVLSEVVFPVNRAMIPIYSKHLARNEESFAKTQCLEMFSTLCVVIFPLCAGMFAVGEIVFPLIFGPQWAIASEMFGWLALGFIGECLFRYFNSYFVAIGKVRVFAKYNSLLFLSLIFTLLGVYYFDGSYITLTQVKFIVQTIVFLAILIFIAKQISVTFSELINYMIRPVIASITMVLIIEESKSIKIDYAIFNLLFLILLGGLSYISSLFFMCIPGLSNQTKYFEKKAFYILINKLKNRMS